MTTVTRTLNVLEPMGQYSLVCGDTEVTNGIRLASSTDIDKRPMGLILEGYPLGEQQVTILTEGVHRDVTCCGTGTQSSDATSCSTRSAR